MSNSGSMLVPTGISARHVHLTKEHLEILFGKDATLTKVKDLSQPGQFASNEFVDIVGPKGELNKVRVLGPLRANTQIEVSRTDSFRLGLKPPVRDSGDIAGSPGAILRGPEGEIELECGVIQALRHVHMTPADAKTFGVHNKQMVEVEVSGERALVFHQVIVRVREDFALDFHVDTDEANAAGLNNGDIVRVIVD